MKVAIFGPGAMGCMFAARLASNNVQTTLVDYDPSRAERLQSSGITLETPKGTIKASPKVIADTPKGCDLQIVLTKSYSTNTLAISSEAPVLTLQNGLGNAELLASMVGSAKILAGVTYEAATLLGEGHVRHVAAGTTYVGAWTACPADGVVTTLQQAGFDADVTEAPGQMIWQKAAVNAAINPLTALLNAPNGRLLELPEIRQLLRDLVVEASKVAYSEGYRFDYSLVEVAEDTCRRTAENISSMLQDVRAGKRTEVDAISGAILQKGRAAALPTPRTNVMWQLIKGLERH